MGPSAKALEQQQQFKLKNEQSTFVKSVLHSDSSHSQHQPKPTAPPLKQTQQPPPSQSSAKVSSQRSVMYDYRLPKAGDSQRRQLNPYQLSLQRPLSPIRETAQAPVIPPSSKAFSTLSDPDNNILFLDNNSRIVNPVNAKTPPPPLWGEILEEENYDPNEEFYDQERAEAEMKRRKRMEEKRKQFEGKKLKRKVVYVYESDSDPEEGVA
jgi:hypothetical protein